MHFQTRGDPDDTICALFDRRRAVLLLESSWLEGSKRAVSRRRRVKELSRLMRKAKIEWEVRINSDLDAALAGLREHHSDNWVGNGLERVWKRMIEEGTLTVFELWETGQKEVLVAADFGHAVGGVFYVATRFYQKEYAKWQPGYLLAFIEMHILASFGFCMWDIGGVNHSPMMGYKTSVADDVDREIFIRLFRRFRNLKRFLPTRQRARLIPEHLMDGGIPLEPIPVKSAAADLFYQAFNDGVKEGKTPTEAAVAALAHMRSAEQSRFV